MNNETVETFDDFSKTLSGETSTDTPVEAIDEIDGQALQCSFCDWTTHKNSKDKPRGLKNHMKKCAVNPENDGKDLPPPKKKMNVNIVPAKISSLIDDLETVSLSDDEARNKLIGDLDILKIKFDTISFNWNYSNTSSTQHLKRQKALFMRVLNDAAGTQALFKCLVLGTKAVEKLADVSNTVDLDGYSQDVNNAEEEIYPILKNLVDTGVLSVGHLTPELRLGMVMASIAINRIEKNKIQRKDFLVEEEQEWS